MRKLFLVGFSTILLPKARPPSSHYVQRIVFYQSFQFSYKLYVLRFIELFEGSQ